MPGQCAAIAQLVEFQPSKLQGQDVKNNDTSTSERSTVTHSNSDSSLGAIDSIDADLQRVVEAWPALPEAVKAGIVAMVKAAANQSPVGEQRR
jgi:hypothetical protein